MTRQPSDRGPRCPLHLIAETVPGMHPWETIPGTYDSIPQAVAAAEQLAEDFGAPVHVNDDECRLVKALRPPRAQPRATIISFGYGHGAPPPAHAVFDVRVHFKDPHVDPALRQLDGRDHAVTGTVMATPGADRLTESVTLAAAAFLAGTSPRPVVIAIGCAGGRHRSVAIAEEAAARLEKAGIRAAVRHRDVSRPVLTPSGGKDPVTAVTGEPRSSPRGPVPASPVTAHGYRSDHQPNVTPRV